MAVGLHPPTGNRVDNLDAIGLVERRTLGSRDLRNRLVQTVLRERMPDIETHAAKSERLKLSRKADVRDSGESVSIIGKRPSLFTSPMSQMIVSLSGTSGPVKAMP